MSAYKIEGKGYLFIDTPVRRSCKVSGPNLSSIQYPDEYQRRRLDALYEKDDKRLEEEAQRVIE